MQPIQVTVQERRKSIWILDFGDGTLYTNRHTGLVYPNRFLVRSKTLGYDWLAETRVINTSPFVQYRFTRELFPEEGAGKWEDSPTRAFKSAASHLEKYKKQMNGAVIIGVSYPNVQELIRHNFNCPVPTFPTMRPLLEDVPKLPTKRLLSKNVPPFPPVPPVMEEPFHITRPVSPEPDELHAIGLLDELEPRPELLERFEDEFGSKRIRLDEQLYWHEADVANFLSTRATPPPFFPGLFEEDYIE
jgi:hypothetical protein